MLVYFLKCWSLAPNSPKETAQTIIQTNPDRIIVWCAEEYAWYEIFLPLFEQLEKWILENNKTINLITSCNIDSPKPWIQIEGTYGILYNFMFAHKISWPNRPESEHKNYTFLKDLPPKKIQPIKIYTCYNHYAHSPRGLIVDLLARDNLLESGIVTFHYPKEYSWKYHNGKKLVDEENFKLNDPLNLKYSPNMFPKNQTSAFMDVVTESRYGDLEYFVSEKTFKSIALFRPFLVLACKDFHQYLIDKFDFKLYDEIFDYSFDNKTSVEDRVEGIIKNIKNIQVIFNDNKKLNEIYNTIKPKLMHNRNRLEEIFNNKNLIVPKSFRFLMDEKDVNLIGASYGDIPDYMIKMGWANIKLNNA